MARLVTRKTVGLVAGACLAATALVGCGSSSGDTASAATFTLAMNSDPGNLDPQASAASNDYQMSFLAYDRLFSIDAAGTSSPNSRRPGRPTHQGSR